jgi:hypothetical protein
VKPSVLMLLAAASMPLAACTSTSNDTLASAGTGVSALAGGDLLTGAVVGAAVGGIAGAVWADRDNDGRADGYYRDGQYYAGSPAEYQSAAATPRDCRSVGGTALTGAGIGAAGGAALGALSGGVSVLGGALVGAAVGGLAGAVWADANNDGCVAGYMREGRYYEGAPTVQPLPADYRSGERG